MAPPVSLLDDHRIAVSAQEQGGGGWNGGEREGFSPRQLITFAVRTHLYHGRFGLPPGADVCGCDTSVHSVQLRGFIDPWR